MSLPLSIQLYTFREAIRTDLRGVLTWLAQIGYIGVEPYGGLDAVETAAICRELGLQVMAMHAPLPVGENEAKVLDMATAYGLTRTIVPSMPKDRFDSIENIQLTCDELAKAARVVEAHGLHLGYHNHDFEFKLIDGRHAYDIFVEHLDPAIFLEVDTYWVKAGGADPTELVKRLGKRAPLLHIKDGPAKRPDPMVAVGDGAMDIGSIIGVSQAEWLVVELDECATDIMTAVEKSYHYLVDKGWAHGRSR